MLSVARCASIWPDGLLSLRAKYMLVLTQILGEVWQWYSQAEYRTVTNLVCAVLWLLLPYYVNACAVNAVLACGRRYKAEILPLIVIFLYFILTVYVILRHTTRPCMGFILLFVMQRTWYYVHASRQMERNKRSFSGTLETLILTPPSEIVHGNDLMYIGCVRKQNRFFLMQVWRQQMAYISMQDAHSLLQHYPAQIHVCPVVNRLEHLMHHIETELRTHETTVRRVLLDRVFPTEFPTRLRYTRVDQPFKTSMYLPLQPMARHNAK